MKIFPIVAGVFEIVLACIIMFMTSVGIIIHVASTPQPQLTFIIYGLVAFILGLMGGIFSIKRTRFVLALVGASSIMCWGILADWLVLSTVGSHEPLSEGIIIGTLTIIFSILSIAFLLTSRTEFT